MSLFDSIFDDLDDVLENRADDTEEPHDNQESNDQGNQYSNDEDNHESNAQDDENKRRVEPKKRVVRNPQPKLNPDRLRGPRGISTLAPFFDGMKFYGKGHEKTDLDRVMRGMEHWCHRLFPKFQFDDCLEKIEKLGSKKVVQTYVKKIRLGMIDISTEFVPGGVDKFDELLEVDNTSFSTSDIPVEQQGKASVDCQFEKENHAQRFTDLQTVVCLASESNQVTITEEQRERMLRNRQLAEKRRLERYEMRKNKQSDSANQSSENSLRSSHTSSDDNALNKEINSA